MASMATPVSLTRSSSHPLGVALAFLGMFVVGSLAVQLVRSGFRAPDTSQGPAPVVAHQASLWQTLGEP